MVTVSKRFMQQVIQRQQHRRRQWVVDDNPPKENDKVVDLTKPIWLPNNPDPQGLKEEGNE